MGGFGSAGPVLCQVIVEQALDAIIFAGRNGALRIWIRGTVAGAFATDRDCTARQLAEKWQRGGRSP
jgi:hypothetical protein